MTAVSILAEPTRNNGTTFRAFAGSRCSTGTTAGEALDAITAQLDPAETGTLIVVVHQQPDRYFSADQQQRLAELMQRWRKARDGGSSLDPEEQHELDALVEAELQAATRRAADLVRQLAP